MVVAREEGPGDKRLVAYYSGAEELGVEGLRAALRSALPEYMVPSAYVRLASIPLTPNGKIDRRALPAPEAAAYGALAYEAPRGPIEQTLAAIWQQLLHLEQISRRANFFELGGHSLLATSVMSQVRESFGVQLALRTLFEHPTLEALAGAIGEAERARSGRSGAGGGGSYAGAAALLCAAAAVVFGAAGAGQF